MNSSEVMPNKKVMPPGRKECNCVVLIILILSCSLYPADRSLAGNWHKTVNGKSRHLPSQAISKLSARNHRQGMAPLPHLSGSLRSDWDAVVGICLQPAKRWDGHAHSHADLPPMELQVKRSSQPLVLPEWLFSLIEYVWHIFQVIYCPNEKC